MKTLTRLAVLTAALCLAFAALSCDSGTGGGGGTGATSYQVIFNTDGGTDVAPQNIVENGLVTEPVDPTKPDHTFSGWYVDDEFTVLWNFDTDTVVTAMTLYAKWVFVVPAELLALRANGYIDTVSMASKTGTNNGYLTAANGTSAYIQATSTSIGFTNNITPFEIGQYEVSYKLWYIVRTWGQANGYTFANLGREGSDGISGAEPSNYANRETVVGVNWRDAIVWCNAYSEMAGLTPCYFSDNTLSTVLKVSSNSSTISATNGDIDNDCVDWSADGYRLPTEAEWQYAASCAATYPFNFASGAETFYNDAADNFGYVGDLWTAGANGVPDNKDANDAVAEYLFYWNGSDWAGTGSLGTTILGSKRPNAFGLYDMSGNVIELCHDSYDSTLPTSETNDFMGTALGSKRVLRGGSWFDFANLLQVGARAFTDPYLKAQSIGFRVVRRP